MATDKNGSAGAPPTGGADEYPLTLYRKCKADAKRPLGYEARQFTQDQHIAAGKEWQATPPQSA